ncbi:hypothetical protein AMS68_008013 [Peltaster fructicola]|uniref:Uncharacterized protein n=1 Tax=Peltaster fructicola TaxID=286661 RepID=A0A6H0Y679_9PEZI|nr:hypothetical protein AMS68_008013 [Peltaster fructicola]
MSSPVDSLLGSPDALFADERRMQHIKTKEECRLANETIDVWCVELPSKHAEGILRMIKENIPNQDSIDLQHLRRFARPKYIPVHVTGGRNMGKELHTVSRAWCTTPSAMIQSPETTIWEWSGPKRDSRGPNRFTTLYLIICPVNIISHEAVTSLLREHAPFASSSSSWAYPCDIKSVTVPLLPPTNPEQAIEWSAKYWPTFYRKTNPFGAHPATISKAEDDLQTPLVGNISVSQAVRLAEKAAEATVSKGYGLRSGAVIIERVEDRTEIIAVAGDARHKPLSNAITTHCSEGNPACHAVMRAIGMVARKRLRCASAFAAKAASKASHTLETAHIDQSVRDAFFLDQPLTDLEQLYYDRDNLVPDGYLCLKLEVFLTQEPCVMCSMALVHSRIGRVIFRDRMPKTGGLTAETVSNVTGLVGLGYGLCWRKELNWQFMCWEYIDKNAPPLPDMTNLSLYTSFKEAVDTLHKSKDNTVDDDVTTAEKYHAPIVHHRHRKSKKHTSKTSSDTASTLDSNHHTIEVRTLVTNPNVSSFAGIHV